MFLRVKVGFIFDGDPDTSINSITHALSFGSFEPIRVSRSVPQCPNHAPASFKGPDYPNKDDTMVYWLSLPPCLAGNEAGLPLLLSTICYCSVFSFVKHMSILELECSDIFLAAFKGPAFGIAGLRDRLGIAKRPLLGMILKPRLLMNIRALEPCIESALISGVDYIIDDELVVNPECCPASERIACIVRMLESVRPKHYTNAAYFLNVTGEISSSIKYIDYGLSHGVDGFCLNCIGMGFASVRYIIERYYGRALFLINNIGRGILTRISDYYITEEVLALLSRLIGADAVYTGPMTREYAFKDSTLRSEIDSLQSPLGRLLPSFAISSGSIHTSQIAANIRVLGTNVMLQMGQGFLGDPEAVQSRVSAIRHILDIYASMNEKEVLSELRTMIETDEEVDQQDSQKATVINNPGFHLVKQRIGDLTDSIGHELSLLKKLEDSRRQVSDSTTLSSIHHKITYAKRRIIDFTLELDEISETQHLASMGNTHDISRMWSLVAEEFLAVAGDEPDLPAQNIAKEVFLVVKDNFVKLKAISEAHSEIRDALPKEGVLTSNLGINDKLKITIPLIPLLLSYESEITLGSELSIGNLWSRIKSYIRNKGESTGA